MSAANRTSARFLVPLCLAAVYVIWSSTYLALRYVVEAMPPLLAMGTRYLIAGGIIFGISRMAKIRVPTRAEWLAAIPVGMLLCVCGNGFVAIAEREVSSGLAAVTCAAMPIFACLIESMLGLRPRLREWFGILLGFAGVLLLAGRDLSGRPFSAALLACAPIAWAIGSVFSRRWPRAPGSMWGASQLLCGGALNVIIGCVIGEHVPRSVPPRALFAFAYLVLIGSVVAFTAYSYLLTRTRTAVATSYAYVNPLLALMLGAAIAGEHVSKNAFVATLLIIAGVAVVVTTPARLPANG